MVSFFLGIAIQDGGADLTGCRSVPLSNSILIPSFISSFFVAAIPTTSRLLVIRDENSTQHKIQSVQLPETCAKPVDVNDIRRFCRN